MAYRLNAVATGWHVLRVNADVVERARHRFPAEPIRTLDAHAEHSAGHHEPGWPERLGQDDAHESDDRPDPSRPRTHRDAGHLARDPETLMRITGYATQYDTAPRGAPDSRS